MEPDFSGKAKQGKGGDSGEGIKKERKISDWWIQLFDDYYPMAIINTVMGERKRKRKKAILLPMN